MTEHLMLIALGPVQDFIFQARRTRDLWFGSHLLSELSRAAARELAEKYDGTLIFPALDPGSAELKPCDKPTRDGVRPPLAIANKILATYPGSDPAGCAKAVRDAVRERWNGIAESARALAVRNDHAVRNNLLADDYLGVWQDQVADALEFYAVWGLLGPDYTDTRNRLEQALAGRKNLREFRQWKDRPGAPKSSLDGGRVSVLPPARERAGDFARWRISPGEQLDAIGVIKRVGFEPDQFIPIVNVAAAKWVKRAQGKPELAALAALCKNAEHFPQVVREVAAAQQFPFDASIMYPSRWPALFEELEQRNRPIASRAEIQGAVRELIKAMGRKEPPAYVACIAADGDHMGRAINELKDAGENRGFSEHLAEFPRRAREIVEAETCLGSLVFAGGDDVLAFVPVASALTCAAQLHTAFEQVMQQALGPSFPADLRPTLSVGVAIAHATEQMGIILELAREAEKKAKEAGRDALAVIVDKRSGGRREFVQSWKTNPQKRLDDDLRLLAAGDSDSKALSSGKVYALQDLLRRFPPPNRVDSPEAAAKALRGYANDLLRHGVERGVTPATLESLIVMVQAPKDPPDPMQAAPPTATEEYKALREQMQAAIERLLIARGIRAGGAA